MHEQPIFVDTLGFPDYAAGCRQLISTLMSNKKLGIPEIQNNTTAFMNSVS